MRATDRFSPALARAAAVLVGSLLWAAVCLAQGPGPLRKQVVDDVIVLGNRRMATQDITALLKTRINREYNPELLQEDVRALMATKRFGNVRASFEELPNGRVKVYFLVYDYPNVVEEVTYQGVKSLKTSELETITGVKKGTPLNPVANQVACQSIVNRYREK